MYIDKHTHYHVPQVRSQRCPWTRTRVSWHLYTVPQNRQRRPSDSQQWQHIRISRYFVYILLVHHHSSLVVYAAKSVIWQKETPSFIPPLPPPPLWISVELWKRLWRHMGFRLKIVCSTKRGVVEVRIGNRTQNRMTIYIKWFLKEEN